MVPRCTLVHGVGVDGAGVDGEDSGHGDVTDGMRHVAVVHTDGSSRHLDDEDDADDDNERHDEHGVVHMLEDDGDMPMVVAQPSSNSVKGEHGDGGQDDGHDDDDGVEDMRSKDEEGNRHPPPPRCTLDTEK